MRKNITIAVIVALVLLLKMSFRHLPPYPDLADKVVSYNFDVRPILSDKCFVCHGPDANKRCADLRLDQSASALAPLKSDNTKYAFISGNADNSEVVKRITSTDPKYQMPTPKSHLERLEKEEVAIIKAWINQGAKYEKHWAYIPPTKMPLPYVKNKPWCKNEIDYFILNKMEEKLLAPNPVAANTRLIKRLAIDITGMLPDDSLYKQFISASAPIAYEKLIDKLFANKRYGEKMAVQWLDIARFSDSYGYQDDASRTQWPYRDWVINAFNVNTPYDQFIRLQLAGDMLPDANKDMILATAFLRNHKYTEEGGVIPEEYRVEYILDKVKTYTRGILGLTFECAQCHDHKYDPFSQKQYYEMFAFFNTSKEQGFEGDIGDVKSNAKTPMLLITKDDMDGVLKYMHKFPTDDVGVSVMGEMKDSIRPTYILKRGAYDQHGDVVQAVAPDVIMPFQGFTKDRLGLANWTVSKKNPITARIFVNQIWQEVFSKAIVNTSGDFGMQGELPSHPELLDWLAVDFMEHNWDIKYLLKKIFMSNTYKQSAVVSKAKLEQDPDNIYLSHAPRIRYKAEFIKDILMQSSGLLVADIGGPSVKGYQPGNLWESSTSGRASLRKYVQDHGPHLYRRGLYSFIKLTLPPPKMIMFDASNRDQCEVKRVKTNTPLQALVMMNDPMVLEAARVFAQKLLSLSPDANANITEAFRKVLCRMPDKTELAVLQKYYNSQLQKFNSKQVEAAKILDVGEYKQLSGIDKYKHAALTQVIQMIYNMDEAITKT